jgi:guanylate kinase
MNSSYKEDFLLTHVTLAEISPNLLITVNLVIFQGVLNVKNLKITDIDCYYLFIKPPSMEELVSFTFILP